MEKQEMMMTEPELTAEEKALRDKRTVEAYREQLKRERKPYGQKATARAINNRRARALAIGEAALKIMDGVRECSKQHLLMPGTLMYMINEKVIYPQPGTKDRKEYEYDVMYQVLANEPAYTEEEIERKCEDLTFRLAMETDEMYPDEEGKDTSSDNTCADA